MNQIPANNTNQPSPKKPRGRPRKLVPDAILMPERKIYTVDELKALLPDWRSTGATVKQVRFAVEYMTNGFDAQAAYLSTSEVPIKKATAASRAYILLKDPVVIKLQSLFTDQWLGEKKAKLEKEIVETLWAQAFYDPAVLMDTDGSPKFKNWDDVPLVMRRVIEGIDTKYFGQGATQSQTTITLTKRHSAVMALAQYIAMMKGLPGTIATGITPETELLLHTIFNKTQANAKDSSVNPKSTEKLRRKTGIGK